MLTIPKLLRLNSDRLAASSEQLKQTELHPISCINWPESFSYRPRAGFRIAHNQDELFIQFTVLEDCTMALITEDNGEVWTDSCVEFFLALDDTGYYNFEFNCIGKALLGFRQERPNPTHAPKDIMDSIKRFSTLGIKNFKEKKIKDMWQLTVAIPATALFRHDIKSWNQLSPRINIYKCGDKLSKPHYLSWQPIDTPKPNFHVPEYFVKVQIK